MPRRPTVLYLATMSRTALAAGSSDEPDALQHVPADVSRPVLPGRLAFVAARTAAPNGPGLQDLITFRGGGPERIVHVEPNLILAFTGAVFFTAKMRKVGDPDDSIKGDMLVIDRDEW